MDWNGLERTGVDKSKGVAIKFMSLNITRKINVWVCFCGFVGVWWGLKGRNWGFLLSFGFSKVNKLHFYSR